MKRTKNVVPIFVLMLLMGLAACRGNTAATQPPTGPEQATMEESTQTSIATSSIATTPGQTATPRVAALRSATPEAAVLSPTTQAAGGLLPTATRPMGQATALATLARTPTQTPTSGVTATKTSTTSTPTQTGWAGEWTIYIEQADGSYKTAPMTVNVNGTNLTASATIGGVQYTFDGVIYNEGKNAIGSYSSPVTLGGFEWSSVSSGQFAGNWDGKDGFCGARPGLAMPNPCFLPPTY